MAAAAAATAGCATGRPSLVAKRLLERLQHGPPQPPKLILDSLSPTASHLLSVSLAHQLPRPHFPAYFQPQHGVSRTFRPPSPAQAVPMPLGHHMVYFPPQLDPQVLMPDGTDPDHCPGEPFSRRMWAGGSIEFAPAWDEAFRLDGRRVACVETVGTPDLKLGTTEADEKLFVDVTRRYYGLGGDEAGLDVLASGHQEDLPRPAITEVRRLVFLRPDGPERATRVARRPVRSPPSEAAFKTTIRPDRTLLFHFSALTFNAHAIHLDRTYTQDVERHRDLLVHGPLSLVLMLSALQVQAGNAFRLARLEYRNFAPLYVDDPLTVCVNPSTSQSREPNRETTRQSAESSGHGAGVGRSSSVWVTGPDGGLAVKGTATFGGPMVK